MYLENIIDRGTKEKNPQYSSFSIAEYIGGINIPTTNVLYDYMDIIDNYATIVKTNNRERIKYKSNPDLLSYDIYGTKDLGYILMMINGYIDKKDFECSKLKVILPDNIKVLGDIFANEQGYLNNSNEFGLIKSFYRNNSIEQRKRNLNLKDDKTDRAIKQLQADISKLRDNIYDSLVGLISDKTDEIISDMILEKSKELQNKIDKLDKLSFDDFLKQKGIIKLIENNTRSIKEVIERLSNINKSDAVDVYDSKFSSLEKRIEQLQQLINRMDDSDKPNEELDKLKQKVRQLEEDINKVINNKDLDERINTIDTKLNEFKNNIKKIENMVTRDITMQILSPVSDGIQHETELFIPYKGKIAQLIFSIDTNTIPKSNFIQTLQIFDIGVKDWITAGRFNLYVNNMYRIYDVNIPINNQYIRFTLSDGNYEYIRGGLTIIARVKEDDPLVLNSNITDPILRKEEFVESYHKSN